MTKGWVDDGFPALGCANLGAAKLGGKSRRLAPTHDDLAHTSGAFVFVCPQTRTSSVARRDTRGRSATPSNSFCDTELASTTNGKNFGTGKCLRIAKKYSVMGWSRPSNLDGPMVNKRVRFTSRHAFSSMRALTGSQINPPNPKNQQFLV